MAKTIIDKNEVLRYLGYRGQALDDLTEDLIDESIKELEGLLEYRYVHKTFAIDRRQGDLWIKDSNIKLLGQDIKDHLANSDSLILMAVSLGHKVDKTIRYYEKVSMAKALILDACASAAIEEICNRVNDDLDKEVARENKGLTSRYSPGYGDLPIHMQKPLLDILEAKKTIGLSVTSHNILIPRKSVTAIIGIRDSKYKNEVRDCLTCNKYGNCNYSRGDVGCGN